MPRRSTIEQLPQEIQDQVNGLIQQGRTIDEITAKLQELADEAGLEEAPSRSAVGRYTRKHTEQLERYREAQQIAGVWVEELKTDSKSDVGRLIAEMLKTIAFSQMREIGSGDAPAPSAQDLHFLARMVKDLESAGKISVDRILKIREEAAKDAAEKALAISQKMAKDQGVTLDRQTALKAIRDELGIKR